jgi:hypothetical protein
MIERFWPDDRASKEGSLEIELEEGKGSGEESRKEDGSGGEVNEEVGRGVSVFDLFTGLRVNRDFF